MISTREEMIVGRLVIAFAFAVGVIAGLAAGYFAALAAAA